MARCQKLPEGVRYVVKFQHVLRKWLASSQKPQFWLPSVQGVHHLAWVVLTGWRVRLPRLLESSWRLGLLLLLALGLGLTFGRSRVQGSWLDGISCVDPSA